jgi:hypothetical protein
MNPWNIAKANPSRLEYWCRSYALGPPGQIRAILFVIMTPRAIENQISPNDTKALERDRYQKAFGSDPRRDSARPGSRVGRRITAVIVPATIALNIAIKLPKGSTGIRSRSEV